MHSGFIGLLRGTTPLVQSRSKGFRRRPSSFCSEARSTVAHASETTRYRGGRKFCRVAVTALRRCRRYQAIPWRDGPPHSWRNPDSRALEVVVDDHPQSGAVFDTHKNSPSGFRAMDLSAASGSLGKTTIKGSLNGRRNTKSGDPFSVEKGRSIFPSMASARAEVLARYHHVDVRQFSRRSAASGIHVNSCPVKSHREHGCRMSDPASSFGRRHLRQHRAGVIGKARPAGVSSIRERDASKLNATSPRDLESVDSTGCVVCSLLAATVRLPASADRDEIAMSYSIASMLAHIVLSLQSSRRAHNHASFL